MTPRSCLAPLLLLCFAGTLFADMSEKEIRDVVNKVLRDYQGRGDTTSLDSLKKLPTNSAIPALLIFYKQNRNTLHHNAKVDAEAMRLAKIIVELPDSAGYMKPLFKTPPVPNPPGWYIDQRNTIADLLTLVDSKFSVRMFGDQLDAPDNILSPKDLGKYLARLNIPGAPFSAQTQQASATPEGIAKWKEWWEANKGDYPEVTK
jgi:hypothetical protein